MRPVLASIVFAVASLGLFTTPVSADPPSARIVLSFDFSDNSVAPAVSNGVFHIATDVLPEGTRGVVRMIAIAPADAGVSNLLCRFQNVVKSRVECGFNFTVAGTWLIRAQYAPDLSSPIAFTSGTSIRVGD
ncbi:MAG: hypothetical protein ACYDEH_03385 [Acidimicrobiales bacterium]